MSALLSVELRRLAARRLVRMAVAAMILGIVIAGVVTFFRSHRLSAETLRAQQIEREQFINECLSGQGPLAQPVPPGFSPQPPTRQECEGVVFGPTDPRFHLTSLKQVFEGTTVPLVLLAWILGASFIGAEWHAGTVSTLLTWEPRRIRVLLAKAAVFMIAAFVGALAFHALLGLALWPAAAARGSMEGAGSAWFGQITGVALRGAALVSIGAAVGFAIASVARSTAAALGVGFAYLLVLENLIGVLRPGWRSWFFSWNAIVFVSASRSHDAIPRTPVEAGLLLAMYGAGCLAIALVAFRRRDVT